MQQPLNKYQMHYSQTTAVGKEGKIILVFSFQIDFINGFLLNHSKVSVLKKKLFHLIARLLVIAPDHVAIFLYSHILDCFLYIEV